MRIFKSNLFLILTFFSLYLSKGNHLSKDKHFTPINCIFLVFTLQPFMAVRGYCFHPSCTWRRQLPLIQGFKYLDLSRAKAMHEFLSKLHHRFTLRCSTVFRYLPLSFYNCCHYHGNSFMIWVFFLMPLCCVVATFAMLVLKLRLAHFYFANRSH